MWVRSALAGGDNTVAGRSCMLVRWGLSRCPIVAGRQPGWGQRVDCVADQVDRVCRIGGVQRLAKSGNVASVRCPLVTDDHRPRTQQGYDTIAADYARLLPRLNAETRLDVAMIDDFADRCAAAQLGPVLDAGCGTGRVSAHLAGHAVLRPASDE
jgi:hypothetical protein